MRDDAVAGVASGEGGGGAFWLGFALVGGVATWLGSACYLCPWKPGWLRLQVRRLRRCCHPALRIRRRGSPNRARYRRKGPEILNVGAVRVSSC